MSSHNTLHFTGILYATSVSHLIIWDSFEYPYFKDAKILECGFNDLPMSSPW